MGAPYDKLWHLLIDRHMSKTQLIKEAHISTNAMAHLGKNEDAMVEVRRFDNKMKLLKQHYEQEIEKTNQNSQGVSVDKVSIAFSDSALARWLSMIMYRSDGDEGNAEVDQRFIGEAFI